MIYLFGSLYGKQINGTIVHILNIMQENVVLNTQCDMRIIIIMLRKYLLSYN